MVKKSKINEIKMEVQGRIIPIQVIRSDRKSIGLEIRQDTSVIARVPYRLSDKGLETFLEKHTEWILCKRKLAGKRQDYSLWDNPGLSVYHHGHGRQYNRCGTREYIRTGIF